MQMNEQEMREASVPHPEDMAELTAYIQSLIDQEHDYGTCVYAMSMAAVAAFSYVAAKLGATGFQASCADLDVVRRTRHLKGPFILLTAEKALFPQYDLRRDLNEALSEWKPWLKEQAADNLRKARTDPESLVHPNVLEHWERIVSTTDLERELHERS